MEMFNKYHSFKHLCLILGALMLWNCGGIKNLSDSQQNVDFPPIQREFRAAWVATVANINWPSSPGLSVEKQKEEAIFLLDLLKDNNFNAVIFQVRPQCDALYKSDLEPWSYYLTGEQGRAPTPLYDPLTFWIYEAHKRGLELHAWLNPYRAHHIKGGEIGNQSIVKTNPELALPLAQGYWWLDPTIKETQEHSLAVVMDIVSRYDVDGIHFDDYFYPYPSYNHGKDFPDDKSWNLYQAKGGKLSRGDWRRKSVNGFIKKVYSSIKNEKPHVKFGLSPFGIWRPGNPASIAGFDQYDQLYADAKLWLNKGWVDYYTPQLYWPINQIPQSFPVLLGWWKSQNTKDRHLWPGISIGRLEGEKAIDETINNVMITRGMLPESPGIVHWSIGPLVQRPEMLKSISEGPYAKPALIPSDNERPSILNVQFEIVDESASDSLTIKWKNSDLSLTKCYVLYSKYANQSRQMILGNQQSAFRIPKYIVDEKKLDQTEMEDLLVVEDFILTLEKLAITAVDRYGTEGKRQVFKIDSNLINLNLDKEDLRKMKAYN